MAEYVVPHNEVWASRKRRRDGHEIIEKYTNFDDAMKRAQELHQMGYVAINVITWNYPEVKAKKGK